MGLQWEMKCKRMLEIRFNKEVVKEYIGEAEHQEGTEYWNEFPTIESVMHDFQLYVKNTNEDRKQPLCPVCCISLLREHGGNALSRRDNETEICSPCATNEALEDWNKDKEQQDQ